jgi:hypothetical protein
VLPLRGATIEVSASRAGEVFELRGFCAERFFDAGRECLRRLKFDRPAIGAESLAPGENELPEPKERDISAGEEFCRHPSAERDDGFSVLDDVSRQTARNVIGAANSFLDFIGGDWPAWFAFFSFHS